MSSHPIIDAFLSPSDVPTVGHVPNAPKSDDNSSLPNFGDYERLELVGRGGMGVVYRAWHCRLKRMEAVKLIRAGQFAGPRDLARFHLEVEAGAALDHPNIVPLYGAGEIDGQPYLAMKWVDGVSLPAKLPHFRHSPRDSARLVAKVARAVHHAHRRGILHRDIKPGNILLDLSGEPLVVDFGLAKQLDAEGGITETGVVAGTPEYMAPEQARGEKHLTVGADVYALGAVLYTLLTGRPPFTSTNRMEIIEQVLHSPPPAIRALNPMVDGELEAVCLKCLEKKSGDRYPSAEALADELDRYVRGEGVTAKPPGIGDWLRQAMRTRPRTAPDHSWQPLAWMGAIRFAAHLAIFGLVWAGLPVFWVWVTLGLHWAGFSVVIWRYLAPHFRRLHDTTRHSMMVSIGHLLATVVIAIAYVPCSREVSADQALAMYPALAALLGVVFFVLGSTHWSRFYFFGLGLLALVPFMAWWPELGPLIHAVSYAACMGYWAYSLKVTFGQSLTEPNVS